MTKAFTVLGLGFGDEGKGHIVDYLCRTYPVGLVVRFSGGQQAGHTVVVPAADGESLIKHVFSQFGSGTLAGADTFISRHMMFSPMAAEAEAKHLQECGVEVPLNKLFVDRTAIVSTPFDLIHHREKLAKIGETCGTGTHSTHLYYRQYGMDTVFAEDMLDRNVLRKKLALQYIRYELCGHPAQLSVERTADHLCALAYQIRIVHKPPRVTDHKYEYVVYEGSQGLLLDEKYGIPHTTWGDLTATNALALMREQEVTRNCSIGVTRAYSTRHGDGFLPEERETLGFVLANTSSYWQGPMRYGLLNTTMLAYAAYVANVALDVVAVTCLDHMRKTSTCMGMTSRPNTIHTVAKLCQVPCDRRENVLLACDHVDVLMRPHQQVDILQRLLGAQSALKSYGMVPDAIDGTLSNVTFRDVTCPCEPSSCVDFAVLDDIAAVKEEHGNAMATT